MKHKLHLITPARVLILGFFMMTTALQAQSQCRTLEDCQRQLTLTDQIIAAKNREIEALTRAMEKLQSDSRDADAQIDKLQALQTEKDRQIGIHENMEKTLQDSLALQNKIIENREAAIKDRDTVIKELVKVAKKSSFEKLMDTLPSIAGILALALAK